MFRLLFHLKIFQKISVETNGIDVKFGKNQVKIAKVSNILILAINIFLMHKRKSPHYY